MARPIRYMPEPDTTVEVTVRTVQARFLLRPSKKVNELVLGVIGRALELYPVRLHMFVVASNHIHMILTARDLERISDFMRHVNSNIAREVGRQHGWRDKFWGRRYTMVAVLDEGAMLRRARYLLSHGCKEGLVMRPGDWPGVNCVKALTCGRRLRGIWYDRSRQYEDTRLGRYEAESKYAREYEVELSPLPCHEGMSEGERRAVFRAMVKDIEAEAGARVRGGMRVVGRRGVLLQAPHGKPVAPSRRPRPMCHCANPERRAKYREDYRWFVALYCEASRRIRAGEQMVEFPPNCFPPPMPFSKGTDPPRAG